MKPSATQIFRSASPPTCSFLLGSCLFIGFLCWALIPMHSFVDFQVDWPMLLFRSRPLVSCRDIIHVATSFSRRDINLSLCSFELVSSSIATSILCRDITSCHCRFHWLLLVSRHQSSVATTAQVTAVSSFQTCHSFKALFLSRPPSLVATSTFVATSRCCRDIIPLVSAQSSAA